MSLTKKAVTTDAGPLQGAPYTPAVRAGDYLFISGQVPLDPATSRLVEGDFEQQVRQCLRNLAALLKQDNLTLDHIVKTTIFLTDLNDFAKLNEVYGAYFTGVKPARSTIQVSRLPLDAKVEIEAIAVGSSEP